MIEALENDPLGKMHQTPRRRIAWRCSVTVSIFRGLIRTRVQQSGLRMYRAGCLPAPVRDRSLRRAAGFRADVGTILRTLSECLAEAGERYRILRSDFA